MKRRGSRSHSQYALRWRVYIEPWFKDLKWPELTAHVVQRWVDWLRTQRVMNGRETLSSNWVHAIFSTLSGALGDAVALELMVDNPALKARRFLPPLQARRARTTRQLLPTGEMARLIDTRFPRLALLWRAEYAFACFTGRRVGEVRALRVSDVHLDAPIPYVRIDKSWDQPFTKTGMSLDLALHPQLRAILEEWLDAGYYETTRKAPLPGSFLFPHGRDQSPRDAARALERHLARAGLARIVYHGLRHSAATAYICAGVPEKIVKLGILGHVATTITERYLHPGLAEVAYWMNRLELPIAGVGAPSSPRVRALRGFARSLRELPIAYPSAEIDAAEARALVQEIGSDRTGRDETLDTDSAGDPRLAFSMANPDPSAPQTSVMIDVTDASKEASATSVPNPADASASHGAQASETSPETASTEPDPAAALVPAGEPVAELSSEQLAVLALLSPPGADPATHDFTAWNAADATIRTGLVHAGFVIAGTSVRYPWPRLSPVGELALENAKGADDHATRDRDEQATDRAEVAPVLSPSPFKPSTPLEAMLGSALPADDADRAQARVFLARIIARISSGFRDAESLPTAGAHALVALLDGHWPTWNNATRAVRSALIGAGLVQTGAPIGPSSSGAHLPSATEKGRGLLSRVMDVARSEHRVEIASFAAHSAAATESPKQAYVAPELRRMPTTEPAPPVAPAAAPAATSSGTEPPPKRESILERFMQWANDDRHHADFVAPMADALVEDVARALEAQLAPKWRIVVMADSDDAGVPSIGAFESEASARAALSFMRAPADVSIVILDPSGQAIAMAEPAEVPLAVPVTRGDA